LKRWKLLQKLLCRYSGFVKQTINYYNNNLDFGFFPQL
jgi:hypothetical protein